MIIKKLDWQPFKEFENTEDAILFMRPTGSKTYRVCSIPETLVDSIYFDDIVELLNAGCTLKRNEVWYFAPDDREQMLSILQTFYEVLGIFATLMEPTPDFGEDDQGKPDQTILN